MSGVLWLAIIFWYSTTWAFSFFLSFFQQKLQYILAPPLTLWRSPLEPSERQFPRLTSSVRSWMKYNSQLIGCAFFFQSVSPKFCKLRPPQNLDLVLNAVCSSLQWWYLGRWLVLTSQSRTPWGYLSMSFMHRIQCRVNQFICRMCVECFIFPGADSSVKGTHFLFLFTILQRRSCLGQT